METQGQNNGMLPDLIISVESNVDTQNADHQNKHPQGGGIEEYKSNSNVSTEILDVKSGHFEQVHDTRPGDAMTGIESKPSAGSVHENKIPNVSRNNDTANISATIIENAINHDRAVHESSASGEPSEVTKNSIKMDANSMIKANLSLDINSKEIEKVNIDDISDSFDGERSRTESENVQLPRSLSSPRASSPSRKIESTGTNYSISSKEDHLNKALNHNGSSPIPMKVDNHVEDAADRNHSLNGKKEIGKSELNNETNDREQKDSMKEYASEGSKSYPTQMLHNDLNLELPPHLDHDDFSKLFKLDKNDDELFSAEDLLEHGIGSHNISAVTEAVANSDGKSDVGPSPRSSVSYHATEVRNNDSDSSMEKFCDSIVRRKASSSSAHFNSIHKLTASLETPDIPLRASSAAPVPYSAEINQPPENTPASIIQGKNNIFYPRRHSSLTPMMPQPSTISMNSEPKSDAKNDNQSKSAESPKKDDKGSYENAIPAGQFITSLQGSNVVDEQSKISAYACLDFQKFTFYVQTLQVIIGRRSENDFSHKVDVNLGPSKSISRRHAKIFYNFGTERFELSIMGKNGAFVDDTFVERGITVPLRNKTKIQIGQIPFQFVLPEQENKENVQHHSKVKDESSVSNVGNNSPGSSEDVESKSKAQLPTKKIKKPIKTTKPPKKVYTLEEIPPEYRTKPTCSYSNLITACLRKYSSPSGMSLSEIYAGIRELFPYYKYCPDGWQSSVRHNLSLNKSFRKVSKEGKGWLWGLDEKYIAEREKQRKKQAEAQAAKAKAAEMKQVQLQAKKQGPMMNSHLSNNGKQPNISQTLAANRSERTSIHDGNQRTMKYLQQQLMLLTKNRRGLDKQVMAQILTQALAMTINQVTQAAKNKGINGNPLTALIDKNPQHLNLILTAAINAATLKVTNGRVKKLVDIPPTPILSNAAPAGSRKDSIKKESPPPMKNATPKPPTPSIANPTNTSTLQAGEPFDPTSLSRFFQPRQPARVTSPVSSANQRVSTVPQKRSVSETDSSDEDSDSSDAEASSDDDSSSDGSSAASDTTEDDANDSSVTSDGDSDSDGENDDYEAEREKYGNGGS
ncbi:HBL081Cp [Eremothecium sinecaudum]|uniref:HBL081Cp n=1 Tax=Eremothecium sinecaudum TaxID=45286 RepID=A0A109UWE9_9SACH|nr:HBL081Cp [Eremothecium sinecaudum]AMD18821.1 HBL081Cp [Eremothecium sinecaudum]